MESRCLDDSGGAANFLPKLQEQLSKLGIDLSCQFWNSTKNLIKTFRRRVLKVDFKVNPLCGGRRSFEIGGSAILQTRCYLLPAKELQLSQPSSARSAFSDPSGQLWDPSAELANPVRLTEHVKKLRAESTGLMSTLDSSGKNCKSDLDIGKLNGSSSAGYWLDKVIFISQRARHSSAIQVSFGRA